MIRTVPPRSLMMDLAQGDRVTIGPGELCLDEKGAGFVRLTWCLPGEPPASWLLRLGSTRDLLSGLARISVLHKSGKRSKIRFVADDQIKVTKLL